VLGSYKNSSVATSVDVPQTLAADVFGRRPRDVFWSSRFYVVTTSVPDVVGTSA